MLFIFGKRFARIGKYFDSGHICYPCKAFAREIRIYRAYFHFCFIPVFPIGGKHVEMRCQNCGDETKLESIVTQYGDRAKTPFYLYSALILCAGIAISWYYWNRNTGMHKAEFVANPVVGDIYTIREEKNSETNYSFLEITGISKDSVKAFHNHLYYNDFVSGLDKDDFFVTDDTVAFKKKVLGEMLERGEIYSVKRSQQ
jgi:hypothetical protein